MFGYQGNADWRDMSPYVVHFTKETAHPKFTAYENLASILKQGVIQARNPYGQARSLGTSQRFACFSEIPLDMLDRLITRRSEYGIGFTKDYLRSQGGNPIWYLQKDSPADQAFQTLKSQHFAGKVDPDATFWRITPFIDVVGMYGSMSFDFQWEREWRVSRDLRFDRADVAFLFLPERLHDAIREFFAEVERTGTGPSYDCPLIDPRWSMERVQGAFVAEPAPDPDDCPWQVVVEGPCPSCGHEHGQVCVVCGGMHGPI